ncbi:MAG: hypothetical protein SFX74_13290 [Fimbriimonadaceae bacterium]|nr:hypothetical protein [Fimbriimonadaceae bacterium]
MMKQFSTRIGLGLSLLAAAAMAYATFGVTMRRVAKVGDTANFKTTANLTIQGMTVTVKATSREKVTAIDDNGVIAYESQQISTTIEFNGQSQEMPGGSPETTKMDNRNRLKAYEGESGELGARLSSLQNVILPEGELNVGDQWTEDVAEDKMGTKSLKGTYKFEKEEKLGDFDCYVIKAKNAETESGGSSSSFTAWLDKTDLSLVKAEGEMKNVQFPGAPTPTDATFTVVRD